MTVISESNSIRVDVDSICDQAVVRALRLDLGPKETDNPWIAVVHLRHRAEWKHLVSETLGHSRVHLYSLE